MDVPIIGGVTDWVCPNCKATDQTAETKPHVRMHICPKLGGITAPMVRSGTKARIVRHDREDYIGEEQVQRDESGRPLMSVTVERPDGSNDTIVYAPMARGRGVNR